MNLAVDVVVLFPDARTTRGVRRLRGLERVVDDRDRSDVAFGVHCNDWWSLTTHAEADPSFAQVLRQATDGGVDPYAVAREIDGEANTPLRLLSVHLDQPSLGAQGPA